MKSSLQMLGYALIFMSLCCAAGAEKVAFLIPQSNVIAGDDPVNDPVAKQTVLDNLETSGEVGLVWLTTHIERNLGYTVNFYGTDEDVPDDVMAANDLIFISEAIGSSSVAADYRVSTKPVIFTEAYILDDMGFTNSNSAFTGGAMTSDIKITNSNHPITKGLPENITVSQKNPETGAPYVICFGTLNDLSILAVGEVLAVLPTSIEESDGSSLPENAPILIVLEKGSPLDIGDTNTARWVFLGYSDVIPNETYGGIPETRTLSVLSDLGIQLLDRCIAWALGKPTGIAAWSLY